MERFKNIGEIGEVLKGNKRIVEVLKTKPIYWMCPTNLERQKDIFLWRLKRPNKDGVFLPLYFMSYNLII